MDDTTNDLHAVLKQILKFDGQKADDFLVWSSKLLSSLSIYNKAIFNILQGRERPSETDGSQATETAGDRRQSNHCPCGGEMPPTRIYSAYSSFRRAAQPSLSYGDSTAPQSWMEQEMDNKRGPRCVRISKGRPREDIRAEHSKMNTRMRSDQDPDE